MGGRARAGELQGVLRLLVPDRREEAVRDAAGDAVDADGRPVRARLVDVDDGNHPAGLDFDAALRPERVVAPKVGEHRPRPGSPDRDLPRGLQLGLQLESQRIARAVGLARLLEHLVQRVHLGQRRLRERRRVGHPAWPSLRRF